MKLCSVVLFHLDLQFCTITQSGYSNGLKFSGKLWFGVGEQQTQLIKMWLMQDPFNPVKVKWTLPENSYLFASDMLEQDRHNKPFYPSVLFYQGL